MVSDRKRDVVDMLKHFNIKIDNPLVFMEQTTMKQFIQGDEKTKYDVLMQALNFRSLEQNFTVTEDNLLNMNETLKRYKDVELGKKREERDKAQDELKAVEHLRTRQEQIVEMEKRVAWAEVQEYEQEIESMESEVHQLEATMEVLNRDIATDQEKLKELEMASEQFQQQLNGIMNDMSLQMEESEKVEKEMQATLLVNPRPTKEEYVKYSFPSKTMEYMASGTPVLTTRLPGMPREYYPYVHFIDEETPEGIAQALKTVLSQSDEALFAQGMNAREFVLESRNNVVQAGKILTMLEQTKRS